MLPGAELRLEQRGFPAHPFAELLIEETAFGHGRPVGSQQLAVIRAPFRAASSFF
jgi:hypothetical protein